MYIMYVLCIFACLGALFMYGEVTLTHVLLFQTRPQSKPKNQASQVFVRTPLYCFSASFFLVNHPWKEHRPNPVRGPSLFIFSRHTAGQPAVLCRPQRPETKKKWNQNTPSYHINTRSSQLISYSRIMPHVKHLETKRIKVVKQMKRQLLVRRKESRQDVYSSCRV